MGRVQREAYNAYMREYMLRRYERRRAHFMAMLGGRCVDCGTTRALEFDHDDATSKAMDIPRRLASAPMQKLREEMAKCVLRCRRCHQVKTVARDYPRRTLRAPHLIAHQQRIFPPSTVTESVTKDSVATAAADRKRSPTTTIKD